MEIVVDMLEIGTLDHPTPKGDDLFVLFNKGNLLIHSDSRFLHTLNDFQPTPDTQPVYCGQWHGQALFGCLLEKIPVGMQDISLREFILEQEEADYLMVSRARQLVTWDKDHQFCTRCGTRLKTKHPTEHTKICPSCDYRHYPRISPCIIVSVRKGNQILLARGPHSPPGRFSNIAGFVEAGETLEQAVIREVFEEVGLRVHNIQYLSSQPWSFPHQLMVGFLAEYAEGEIKPAPGEIVEAGWFPADNLPQIPPTGTISGQIIRTHLDWLRQQQDK